MNLRGFRTDTPLDYFIAAMIIVKFIFLITTILSAFLKRSKNSTAQKINTYVENIAKKTEIIFMFGISVFLAYYFRPNQPSPPPVTAHMSFLMCVYGIIVALKMIRLL